MTFSPWLAAFLGLIAGVTLTFVIYSVAEISKARRERDMAELTARIVAALEQGKS